MPYTREDFQREIKEEVFQSLTDEDLERLLKGLKPEDILERLNPEDIDAYLKKIKSQRRA